MKVGAVLVFGDLLVRKGQYLVNVVEPFGVNVSEIISTIFQRALSMLTTRDLPATQVTR